MVLTAIIMRPGKYNENFLSLLENIIHCLFRTVDLTEFGGQRGQDHAHRDQTA